jgi:UDP-N-acetylmuramate: L-alanyl-gamma-D-glutamyl-meso-diaminopimelate ligase
MRGFQGALQVIALKFHLIGICGTGMGSLAGLLHLAGHHVAGSDAGVYPPMSTQLQGLGVEVMDGYRAENLDWGPDVVVVGNVCRRDHVEAVAAREQGLTLTSFPAVLEEQFLADRHPVVVAGTHGKTTCAALLSWLLYSAGQNPSFCVGGIPSNFERSFRLGGGDHFVVEGDEYDTAFFDKESKFLHYRPRTVLLTGIEFDHADMFDDLAAVHVAFGKLIALVPPAGRILVWSGSPDALRLAKDARCTVEAYALDDDPDTGWPTWRARILERDQHGSQVEILRDGERVARVWTTLVGDHNLRNLVGCFAVAVSLGAPVELLVEGTAVFQGVKRRQQVRGVAMGVTVIDDFAHHPTAVRETLHGLRHVYNQGRLYAVFEPRSATSRRAIFQQDYATAFEAADEAVIGQPYDQSRIPEADRLNAENLVSEIRRHGVQAHLIPQVDEIVEHLATRVRPGDCVAVMSSGAFGGLHRKLLERIGDAVMPAEPDDLAALDHMLEEVGLDVPDLADHLDDYIVLRGARRLVGCIGLEIHGQTALLKDLALLPERRGEGLSWLLAEAAVRAAARRGVKSLYMFGVPETMHTGKMLGFAVVECNDMDEQMKRSKTLTRAWYTRGTCLRLDLDPTAEPKRRRR